MQQVTALQKEAKMGVSKDSSQPVNNEVIYQTRKTVFDHISKHREES